jgi:hypothetical protein
VNIYSKLLIEDNYSLTFQKVALKAQSQSDLLSRAPVLKSINLNWCLKNQSEIIKYFISELKDKTFKPQLRQQSLMHVDKVRTIYSTNWIDKLFESTFTTILFEETKHYFCKSLFSHRRGYSNLRAIRSLADFLKINAQQKLYIEKVDISSYTDNI